MRVFCATEPRSSVAHPLTGWGRRNTTLSGSTGHPSWPWCVAPTDSSRRTGKRDAEGDADVGTTDLLLTGDINCKDDGLLSDDPLALIAGELATADFTFGNLEGAFHDPTVELPYKPGWYHCEPEMLARITGHFDAVACANNVHFGEAIAPSLQRLDDAGMLHGGAGEDLTAARRPAIVDRGGTTVGLLSYTSVFWPLGHAATDASPGVAAVRVRTSYQPHPRLIEMPGAPAIVRSQPERRGPPGGLRRHHAPPGARRRRPRRTATGASPVSTRPRSTSRCSAARRSTPELTSWPARTRTCRRGSSCTRAARSSTASATSCSAGSCIPT